MLKKNSITAPDPFLFILCQVFYTDPAPTLDEAEHDQERKTISDLKATSFDNQGGQKISLS